MTVHHNEGNYLTHTQGKRHQSNLARRAQLEARRGNVGDTFLAHSRTPSAVDADAAAEKKRRRVVFGRPAYRVTKQFDVESQGHSLLFQIEYPEIEPGSQPRHRFMSAFEQRQVAPSPAWQLLLFAAEPYETVAFKIPNRPIFRDAGSERFFTHWDPDSKSFALQLVFQPPKANEDDNNDGGGGGGGDAAADQFAQQFPLLDQ
jgi:splicing factor 3A subunit 2